MTGSNMEVNNKNTHVSGRATCTGSTGRLTDKILANPHTALCKEPRRQILKEEDHERQHFNRGKQWWDPGNEGDPGLISQRPLLDGGEGKSTCSNNNKIGCLVDDKKHEIQDLGHDHDKHEIQIGGIQEDKILWEKGDIQDDPTSHSGIRNLTARIISTGALAHIAITEEASTTTTFTPRSLLGLCNPGDTQKRGGRIYRGLTPHYSKKLETGSQGQILRYTVLRTSAKGRLYSPRSRLQPSGPNTRENLTSHPHSSL